MSIVSDCDAIITQLPPLVHVQRKPVLSLTNIVNLPSFSISNYIFTFFLGVKCVLYRISFLVVLNLKLLSVLKLATFKVKQKPDEIMKLKF